MLLFLLVASAFFTGCDDNSKQNTVRVGVDYELDRQFAWDPGARKLKGSIRVKTTFAARDTPPLANAYGINFELSPGDRTTILVMTDGEGTYFTGEYPDLPIQLPRLLSVQRPDVSNELIDPEACAACEVAVSAEPVEGNYCFLFSCYSLKAGWLFNTVVNLPAGRAISDAGFVSLAKGKEEFRRPR